MDWQARALQLAEQNRQLSVALYVCAAIAGLAIGGWWGLGVFMVFAVIASA